MLSRAKRFPRPIARIALLFVAASIGAGSPLTSVQASVAHRPDEQSGVVGEGPNRAGLVVRFDDNRVETICVRFSEEEIGGDELLRRSGLDDVVIAPEGSVCRIEGLGCPSDDCFCQCPFPNCEYWAYYHRNNGVWEYSEAGAMSATIQDGSLDGWSWGQGDFQSGVEPPEMDIDQVCPAASQSTTATATATATGATQPGAQAGAPQVNFSAAPASLVAGQCTTLSWQTSNATSVTLNGATVSLTGSQQACPPATQTWTLLALNALGQTTRQVSVQVGTAPPTVVDAPPPIVTRAPQPLATLSEGQQPGSPPGARPMPVSGAATAVIAPGGGEMPLAPTAEPSPSLTPSPGPTATRYVFSLLPTETPRPRRVLGADGRPTPTAILVARAGGNSGQAPAVKSETSAAARTSGPAAVAESRSFSLQLVPGYVAYVVCLGILLFMGWYTLRRRNGVTVATSVPAEHEDEREALTSQKE